MKPAEDATPLGGAEYRPICNTAAGSQRQDPLRRFTPTPYATDLPVMGRTVRFETNDLRILEHVTELFSSYPGSRDGRPDFRWKIVIQSHPHMTPPWPKRSAFSDRGLRFAEFGQRNFIAVDLDAREGIGFLAEGLAEDKLGLTSPFIDTIFYLTAGSLGLVSLTAACVATGDKGILVMGPADSGKTTACYLSTKVGLEFHADQAVFLEPGSNTLGAWGDFFPAAFRPQALQFLPELQTSAQPFSYCDFRFYYLNKRVFQAARARPVEPVCCVYLGRKSAPEPRLSPVSAAESSRRLSENLPFKDDDRFNAQRAHVLNSLANLPAYQLDYASDPAIAAVFLRDLLARHEPLGHRPQTGQLLRTCETGSGG
jgi:hypothetical protein